MRGSVEERFWAKVSKGWPDGCWLWTGALNSRGYGCIGVGTRDAGTVLAHRLSWGLHRGPVTEGMEITHICDQPMCVNPAHLRMETHAENMVAMVQRGRSARGEHHGRVKLSEDQVRLTRRLRNDGLSQQAIADKFGVTRGAIKEIDRGANWAWLE